MSAPIVEIADEVVTMVNAFLASIDQPEVATRERNPRIDLKDIPKLRVVVYPLANLSEENLARRIREHDYAIEIAVQSKLGPPNTEEWNDAIDDMTELVDNLAEVFRDREHMAVTKAYPVQVVIDPIFDSEHLDQKNTFTSVITLTLRQDRRRV